MLRGDAKATLYTLHQQSFLNEDEKYTSQLITRVLMKPEQRLVITKAQWTINVLAFKER